MKIYNYKNKTYFYSIIALFIILKYYKICINKYK